jgi:BirA family biotin operon repressor/biotin-[acetyl-CoA-carboxylase] ligase
MDVARREAQKGIEEGTVVLADEQTAGRGRLKRTWLAPQGNIALSLILRPRLSYLPSLIMLASLAVLRSVESTTGLKAQIKWPNDVLIEGKKVCGILIENDVQGQRVNYSIVGIGVNVNLRVADFPEIHSIATSLSHELGDDMPRLDVLRCLLIELDRLYLASSTGGSLYTEWRDNLVTLGQRIRVTQEQTIYEGIAESVTSDGSLLLRDSDGNLIRIVAGDVTLRTE